MRQVQLATNNGKKPLFLKKFLDDFKKHKTVYIMSIPIFLYYIIFHYAPMVGIVIGFKDYRPGRGIFGSSWVGLKYFMEFFNSYYFWRLIKNTIVINFSTLIFGFPAPIILALLLNEIKNKHFKKAVQTITYMPHFISVVIITGIIIDLVGTNGLINDIGSWLGFERQNLLNKEGAFVPIYVMSDIWQHVGWGTIIYLAALAGIDPALYEASKIDGAGRWKQMLHVTLPGIIPTISILLIMRIGRMMSIGWEKIVLLYNPSIFTTADVISSFVYRKGILEANYSYASAVGIFNSVINIILLAIANRVSRRLNGSGLW